MNFTLKVNPKPRQNVVVFFRRVKEFLNGDKVETSRKPLQCFRDVTTLLALACTDIPRYPSSPSTSAAVAHFSMLLFLFLVEEVFLFCCFQIASLIAILTIKALTMLFLYTGRGCSKCLFYFVLIRFAVFGFFFVPFPHHQ